MTRTTRVAAVLALALGTTFLLAAPAPAGKAAPAPEGLPKFYAVPAKLPAKPGRLVKSEKIDVPDLDGTVYRVMYTSTDLQDEITAVTGVIAVPAGEAPDTGFPVVTYAHGTTGLADQCAPSLEDGELSALLDPLLAEGWIIAGTDYAGQGTPGLHPYIAGEVAARNTIDIARAAHRLRGADPSDDYIVWGHSQGGHTAMHNLRIGADYAPELDLAGVVAGAPPSQFNLIYEFLITSPFRHYLLMAAGGLNAAYGDEAAPLDEVLTPEGIELVPLLEEGCSDFVRDETEAIPFDTVTKANPFEVPKWRAVLEENDPQQFDEPADTRLLIIHGGEDEQIPTVSSQLVTDHLCEIDQQVERWVYPAQSHAGVIGPSLADMIGWMHDRLAGEDGAYAPTGQADVEVSGCP